LVRLKLLSIADMHEEEFAPAQYKPLGGVNLHFPGSAYDREAVDRFFAALASEAAPDRCVLPEVPGRGSDGDGPSRRPRRLSTAWRQYASDCQLEWQRVSYPRRPPGRRRAKHLRSAAGRCVAASRRNGAVLVTCAKAHDSAACAAPLTTVRHSHDQAKHGR
jgi:hypothetical protein